ncbi:B12-binding domain-containing radical SAM protein [Jiella mangrovi]|uniref:Radical SAM protein n=1 Tax=Jiella mangrovi TaxID=2821407 RepID=A0ABS4BBG7_9HYPH|nr:radical SAM protein [Jiella mangrovi]MBP0614098.1 radical SAM protein [Jiella mangrovi]
MTAAGKFHIVFVKPTHYDSDGYPLQWRRSMIPSNSLACLNGIAQDCIARKVLGDVEVVIHTIDETNTVIKPARIMKMITADGGRGLLALVGVQSNQFPRAVDLARPFLAKGVPVCLGGFHVAGSLSMLESTPPEIEEASRMGISFFVGEAEGGRFDQVLRDAYAGRLQPYYHYGADLPGLEGSEIPFLERSHVEKTSGLYSSFDIGRGCPFQCSFCTIINVQGRVSRFRSADDLEAIVRANWAIGVDLFFVTDDNLARNRNWEACFDRLIHLAETEGIRIRMQIQVDTRCHKIPGFIEKAVRAGVDQVFVGMENINPDNLIAAKKNQNKIVEYREMFLEWKKRSVMITAGYIIGFPNDTRESILHDIDVIKNELPIDLIYFTNLTPLPGSEDHQTLFRKGEWMDPDLNKYDLNHRVTHHRTMSDAEWDQVYREAWDRFYTWDQVERIMKRMRATGSTRKMMLLFRIIAYSRFFKVYGCHPLEGGTIRVKSRGDRRHGMKLENPLVFYPRYLFSEAKALLTMVLVYRRAKKMADRIWADPAAAEYRDLSITPPDADELSLALYSETRGTSAEIARMRRQETLIRDARAKKKADVRAA